MIVSVGATWWFIVMKTRRKGWWPVASHAAGAATVLPVSLASFAVTTDPGMASLVFLGVVAGMVYLIVKPWRAPPPITMTPSTPEATTTPSTTAKAPTPAEESDWRAYAFPNTVKSPSDDDAHDPLARWRATEQVRKQSLEAMRKATKARAADKKKRGERDTVPLGFDDAIETEEYRRGPKIRHGDRIDVIRFDYINRQGEFSRRRVAVQMVGEWKFEGIDLDNGQERTFRYDSVVGDITSEETGEIQAPEDWRDSIR